jgi:hypothetical protein
MVVRVWRLTDGVSVCMLAVDDLALGGGGIWCRSVAWAPVCAVGVGHRMALLAHLLRNTSLGVSIDGMEMTLMYKTRLLALGALAVLVAGLVAVAPALASSSFELSGRSSDELAEQPTMTESMKLEEEGDPTIECKKVQIHHGVVVSGAEDIKIGSIRFDSCEDESEPENCAVSTIETKEISDRLESEGEAKSGDTEEKFTPASGTEFAQITFQGPKCKNTKSLELGGDLVSKIEDNEGSEDTHKLNFNMTKGSDPLVYGVGFAAFHVGWGWYMVVPVFWTLLF